MKMKVGVIGQGYVGLPIAKSAALAGFHVIGFDVSKEKIDSLKELEGESQNYKPTFLKSDLKSCDIYIIAVPTPLNEVYEPDISYIKAASEIIAEVVGKNALIINESTSYPGTLREIIEPIVSSRSGSQLLYASAPERIDPGNSDWNIQNTPRVVAGLTSRATTEAVEFYKSFCTSVISVSSPEIAEAAKLFENTFRQVNIALVNEFTQICEKFGMSSIEVISAASSKPFGFLKFMPGLGVGGHCIPIDPVYLEKKAQSLGASTSLITQSIIINRRMPLYVLKRIKKIMGKELMGKKICIVGLSYKKDISDLRESPSIELWDELSKAGCTVYFHDELVLNHRGQNSIDLNPASFDLAVVAVRHSNLEISKLFKSSKWIFDCTGTIEGALTF